MKTDIHPDYQTTTIKCVCGNSWDTRSTAGGTINVDICSACHPFYTGKQKLVDTAGRVERFRKRYEKVEALKKTQKKDAEARAREEAPSSEEVKTKPEAKAETKSGAKAASRPKKAASPPESSDPNEG